jgi:ferredoxin
MMIQLLLFCIYLSSCCQVTTTAFQQQQQLQRHHHPLSNPTLSTTTKSGHRLFTRSSVSLFESYSDNNNENNNGDGRIDTSIDGRLCRIRLSRAPGIEWGTDLSFSFVYVRGLDPTGEASLSGQVNVGDQLCELIPVSPTAETKPINLLGASFDFVMTSFASMDKSVSEMDLVFFRGSKQELKVLCNDESAKSETSTITVTVIENKGSPQEKLTRLQAEKGVNVRELLVDNGINVYQSITRWTNCKGKQLCGTCIVNIAAGSPNTNWKSMDEASTLRSNPDSYRLSCVAFAHGDITVETFPPINADQWTR